MDKIDEEISAYAKNIEDIKMEWLSCWDLDRVNEFILKKKKSANYSQRRTENDNLGLPYTVL